MLGGLGTEDSPYVSLQDRRDPTFSGSGGNVNLADDPNVQRLLSDFHNMSVGSPDSVRYDPSLAAGVQSGINNPFELGDLSTGRLEEFATGSYEPGFNNFYDTNVRDPLLEDFQENVLPGIGRKFATSGFYGSDRIRSDDLAREDLLDELVKGRANLALQDRENFLGRKFGAQTTLDQRDVTARGQDAQVGVANQQANAALQQILFQIAESEAANVSAQEDKGNSLISGKLSTAGTIAEGDINRQIQEFQNSLGGRDKVIQTIMAALGMPMSENVVTANPGSVGAGTSFATAAAPALIKGFFGGYG